MVYSTDNINVYGSRRIKWKKNAKNVNSNNIMAKIFFHVQNVLYNRLSLAKIVNNSYLEGVKKD